MKYIRYYLTTCKAAILPAAIIALIVTCTEFNNPCDPQYKGDYRFTASFVQQPDTFRVFTPYNIEYTVTGIDTFETFRIVASAEDMPDTLSYLLTGSTMQVYFTKPFTGNVRVIGVRPNLKEVAVELPVSVVNPFTISGNPVAKTGQTLSLALQNSVAAAKSVRWYLDTVLMVENTPVAAFTLKRDTVFSGAVYALVMDSTGNMISSDTVTVQFGSQLPAVSFSHKTIEVPTGKQMTIDIGTSYCDSVVWTIKSKGKQVTSKSSLVATWAQAGKDTIVAQGKNRYGQVGNSDTLYVTVTSFKYTITPVSDSFPDTIRVRKWASWKAIVEMNGTTVYDSVHFIWNVTPDNSCDSLRFSSDSSLFMLYYADSTGPVTVSVRATVGADSTNRIYRTVTMRTFRPVCSLVVSAQSAAINTDVGVTVTAGDGNTGGSVEEIWYQTDEMTVPLSTNGNTNWNVRFATPGARTVKVWAIDNDGFSSDTAAGTVLVSASKPYFERVVIDTAIFINSRIALVARAQSGNSGDTIVSYLWDYNNDGNWDKTTASGSFDSLYQSVQDDTIRVGCKNQRGDSAEVAALLAIHVLAGTPQVQSVTAEEITYINAPVAIHVTASDTNGTVDSIAVKVNNGTDTVFAVTPKHAIDTAVTLSFGVPGKYLIAVAVYDNHDNVSEYKALTDTLVVSNGSPVAKGITPDTVWIFDSTSYILSAKDINGTVQSCFVQWGSQGAFTAYTDSIVTYSFSSAGKQYVKMVVIDNDGLTSDTITDSVFVRLGRPMAALTIADTVYCFKNVPATVRSIDSNGTINQWTVSFDGGQSFITQTDSNFTYSYQTEGRRQVRAYVIDDDGIASDTVGKYVYAKLGAPSVFSITTNPVLNSIYIKDAITFTVKGKDENDYIDSILVSWNGDTVFEARVKAVADSAVFTNTFAKTEAGTKQIRFRVKDIDGLVKDSVVSITVQAGAPKVDSVKITSVSGNNFFVKDNNTFRVYVSDKNGTPKKIYAAWNNETVPAESLSITTGYGEFTHQYDTLLYGDRTVRFWVCDEDSVMSANSKDTAILVRLGRPVLLGATFGDSIQYKAGSGGVDTVFYVNHDNVNSTVQIDTVDTNGSCVRFYWDWDANGTVNATTTTTTTTTDGFEEGQGRDLIVYCKDDDSLVSNQLRLYVYHDAPPPTTTTTTTSQPGMPDVRLAWFGLDAKDDSLTQFAVVIGATSTTVNDTVVDFTAANSAVFGKSSGYITFTFNPQEYEMSSNFFFKVIAKDARGSKPDIINTANVMYPY